MSKKFLSFIVLGLVLMICIAPLFIQAQGTGNPMKIVIENPFSGQKSIQGLIEVIIKDILMPIGGVVAVLMIMYAGFLYVTARGNSAKIKAAHQALLYAVIGAAILLGAWVISQAISNTITQLKS